MMKGLDTYQNYRVLLIIKPRNEDKLNVTQILLNRFTYIFHAFIYNFFKGKHIAFHAHDSGNFLV